jgi:hypothetical protein
MQAWKRRLEQLFRKEARCPACAKAARLNADTNDPKICPHHISLRRRMAFGSRRMT